VGTGVDLTQVRLDLGEAHGDRADGDDRAQQQGRDLDGGSGEQLEH
jgi:hypothetical protein